MVNIRTRISQHDMTTFACTVIVEFSQRNRANALNISTTLWLLHSVVDYTPWCTSFCITYVTRSTHTPRTSEFQMYTLNSKMLNHKTQQSNK